MALVKSVQAETSFRPNSIRISWTLDESLGPNEEVRVLRRQTTYPESATDGTVVFNTVDSNILDYEDRDLDDNTYYYYTVLVYNTVTSEEQSVFSTNQAFALSYKFWNSADLLYNLFPEETRSLDQQTSGDLKRLAQVMGNNLDLYRSEIFAMEYNRLPQLAPANILPHFSQGFGFPAERALDLNVLRRIAEGIVSIYKRKGTCQAIQDFVKLFSEFDSLCLEDFDPSFKLWDDESRTLVGTLSDTGTNYAEDNTQSWSANEWVLGSFTDVNYDNLYDIESNDSTTLFFDNKTPPVIKSDSGTTGQGVDDSISGTADNTSAFTSTVDSGDDNTIVDTSLSAYPDNYWNLAVLTMTSGANAGQRRFIKSFDTDTATIELDSAFANFVSPGDTYSISRTTHIVDSALVGIADNALAGREISITAGTNSGKSSKIARNFTFGGSCHIVVSNHFTEPCDNTSVYTIESTGQQFQDTSKTWVVDEWKGYKLNVGVFEFTILSNTSDTLTVHEKYANISDIFQKIKFDDLFPTATESYSIENQYLLTDGKHSFMFDPAVPFEFRNTFRDPASFLFGGASRSVLTFGSNVALELPIVLLNAAVATGRSTDLTPTTLTDANASFTPGALVGLRLNPNARQDIDFLITANTSTTITVDGILTLVAESGNNYYVVDNSSSIKTRRLKQTVGEFCPHYLTPVVFHEIG